MNEYYPFVNTPLPYSYSALEPYIDRETMQLHHDKHLQSYITNLNDTLRDQPQLQKLPLEQLIVQAPRMPAAVRTPIRRYAGGVYNHRLFFSGMTGTRPTEPIEPAGPLAEALRQTYGGLGPFQDAFQAAAMSVFGSGYAWLAAGKNGAVGVFITPNQDTPLTQAVRPILTIDVWEHAYYLHYQNRRQAYVDNWFHVVDWDQAEKNYGQWCAGSCLP